MFICNMVDVDFYSTKMCIKDKLTLKINTENRKDEKD